MIELLTGVVELKKKDYSITLVLSGIGLNIFLLERDFLSLKTGQKAKLYIYTQIQAEKIKLFGFLQLEQRKLFEMIVSIKGVSSKSGLALIGAFSQELTNLIISEDLKSLSRAPGIGLKTAQRIVFELKNKIDKSTSVSKTEIEEKSSANYPSILEAQETLISLDYSKKEIKKVFEEIEEIQILKTEEILQIALSKLSLA